jgi:glycosyltransferase involved in cell wall biosynthesis
MRGYSYAEKREKLSMFHKVRGEPPVNTLHVDLGAEWRGGQSQALLLMQGLRARGYGVELVAVEGGALARRAAAGDIPVHTVSRAQPRLAAAWRLARLKADLVHCHDAHALTAAWLAGATRRARLVASRRLAHRLAGGRLGLARYRAAGRIVAVSEFVKRSVVASGIPPGHVEVVYDGVPAPPRASETERNAARRSWSDAPEEPLIGCVGYLLPEKGQETLIRAVPLCGGRAARSRVVLAGDGADRARLEQLARQLGVAQRVRFAGHVEDVEAVYRALDVFVFPSLAEPLGSSLLAAMAHALPVVASGSGAVPEIVREGENGLLAPAGDPAAFAAAVSRLLEDPALARSLGEAARKTVEERFSDARMVEATLAVYAAL